MPLDDHLHIEEEFHKGEKKEIRQDRKRAQASDRSKYKKTDAEKVRTEAYTGDGISGRVLSLSRAGVTVQTDQGTYIANLRGTLKKEKTRQKNLVVVGDIVYILPQDDGTATIDHVAPRYSILSRADNLRRRQEHLIASNIDQVFIVTSLFTPRLKPFLIDRYIITARQGNLTPIVILNKVDLLKNPPSHLDPDVIREELELYHDFIAGYAPQTDLIEVSVETGEGLEKVHDAMVGKSSVFSGQSGVGKTSLINKLLDLDLAIGDIRHKTRKGTHTTSNASLIPLHPSGFCIDTPGIKSFGILDLNHTRIETAFPEIGEAAQGCRFPNCKHYHEPECSVKAAVAKGTISTLRYESYITLFTNQDS